MFNFVFDKRSLVMLLTGLAVAGGLLFFAGLLVGVNLGLPSLRPEMAYPPRPMPVREAARPCPEPVIPAEAKPKPVPEPVPEEPVQPTPAPAPLPQVAEEEPPPPPPLQEQAPRTVPAALRSPQPGAGAFSVQVGAFRVKENSDALIEDLKSRGYEPYVVQTASSLLIVRVGRFAGREEAQRVAAALKSENLEAVVRQVKQL